HRSGGMDAFRRIPRAKAAVRCGQDRSAVVDQPVRRNGVQSRGRSLRMTQFPDAPDSKQILSLEEITNLTEEGGKPADTLMNVVALIAARFRTDVCSAYLLEPDRSNLVLAATVGLHPSCIGTLRMPIHEGLAGLVAEQVMPVAVEDARKHPR